jgi:UDP-glucose:(heptosyl)LPS alpha-1,3-glucosyltransferase
MKTPTVALIRQRYAHDGGAERFVSRALEALKTRSVQLTLITREWRGGEGFEVITCNPFYLGRLWRDWSFARAVCRRLEQESFDLVQSHERISCCDVYRAGDGVHREWLRQRARTQGALGRLATALNPYHYYVKAAEKRLFGSARLKAVICNSKMVKDEIRNYFGVAEEKLRVIYSGVDTRVFHPDLKRQRAAVRAQYVVPENAALFLFVGSGFARKGVSTLLEAMARLSADAYLLVVGHDKNLEKYQARAQRLGLGSRVRFAGRQGDVKPFYGAADGLVLPTLYDPFPNVALEAMASGVPVITSSKCGAAELIRDGENGFVCDALDSIALSERMRQLADREKAERIGKAARDTVAGLHLETMSDKLLELYGSLLSRA